MENRETGSLLGGMEYILALRYTTSRWMGKP